MATVCQFVDSVDAAPTVRFNFSSSPVSLQRQGTFIGPPTLNRAMAQNLMRDGLTVSSSSLGWREVQLTVLIEGSADTMASSLQTLVRELDRETNWLKWHPDGATKPVFLRTFRSVPENLDMSQQAVDQWRVTVTLLAAPEAVGVRETLGPYTVNNDPAAGSNGHYVDLAGIIGDAPAPLVIHDSTATRERVSLAARQHGTPSDLTFFKQCESMDLMTDTTNPGGAADSAMSGSGTTNYARTSFATTEAMSFRLEWDMTAEFTSAAHKEALVGTYAVYAVLRVSSLSTVYKVSMNDSITGTAHDPVTLPVPDAVTERMFVNLGTLSVPGAAIGLDRERGVTASSLLFSAQRVSGSGTLDWDYVILLPSDERTLIADYDGGENTSREMVFDGVNEAAYQFPNGGTLFSSAVSYPESPFHMSGGFPEVVPNQTNRLYVVIESPGGSGTSRKVDKSIAESLTFYYWPRYTWVRPAAT